MSEFKIMEFNCRGIKHKVHDIDHYCNVNNVDVICLNETKLRNSNSLKLSNFNLACSTDSPTSRHGSAILTRNHLTVNKVEKPIVMRNEERQVLEIIRINVSLKDGKEVWITCIYNSPGLLLRSDLIFDNAFCPNIVAGDFNSPHEDLC